MLNGNELNVVKQMKQGYKVLLSYVFGSIMLCLINLKKSAPSLVPSQQQNCVDIVQSGLQESSN
jgi:hypothetical protein